MDVTVFDISDNNTDILSYFTKKAKTTFVSQVIEYFKDYGELESITINEQDYPTHFCINYIFNTISTKKFNGSFGLMFTITIIVSTSGAAFLTSGQRKLAGRISFSESPENRNKIINYYYNKHGLKTRISYLEVDRKKVYNKINVDVQLPDVLKICRDAVDVWVEVFNTNFNGLIDTYPELAEQIPSIRDIFLF